MSINQNLLSTNTLSFITNTWNQPQASCGPTLREKEKRSEKRGMSINQDYCPPTKFHSSQTYGINHKLLWDQLFGLLLQSPFVNNCIKQLLRYLRRLLLLLLLFGLPSCTKVSSKHLALLLVQFPFAHHKGIRQIPCSSFCSTSFEKFTISSKYVYLCCSSGRAIVVVD
ncbi:hypothetical protein BDL97_13G017200 [Sphagnum fallax]|nr:hypothetical protein BDL97_13G017200 [Sphagnum fallax]KAH8942843.1 hypothetical protein BDL97_13G017200 [Sphagnum fallax]